LLGGWAFMDGALQVRPESLDLLLYPLMLFALMTTKKKSFAVMAIATIYSHGPAALSNIYGLAANQLSFFKWRKTMIICVIIALPIIILSLVYLPGAFLKWGGASPTENPQELEFWTNPAFIPIYAGACLLGVPFLFAKHKTAFESLLTWGFVGNLVMLPLWADRWLHYSSIPLAMLAGMGIARLSGKKRVVAVLVVVSLYMIYYMTFIHLSAMGNWWQPGD
jgi:hypothetical protein